MLCHPGNRVLLALKYDMNIRCGKTSCAGYLGYPFYYMGQGAGEEEFLRKRIWPTLSACHACSFVESFSSFSFKISHIIQCLSSIFKHPNGWITRRNKQDSVQYRHVALVVIDTLIGRYLRPPNTVNMASLNTPPRVAVATAKTGKAFPPQKEVGI